MDELDIAFKAFQEFSEQVVKVPEIRNFMTEMRTNANVEERLECFTSVCKIDEDWVNAIKDALPYVSNAVMENRQFVRNDGEVLPIEKIKTVGKESIVDLSKHSNYITRAPGEDGKIIPDKLMMPLKENDFAVYENRFLYSLLIYLCQFIEIRLNEILAITGKYHATTILNKHHATTTRNLTFQLTFEDTRYNDPNVASNNESADALNIIKSCLNDAKLLLMTPLMKEVSKAPMVHAPIVKTNVFKFDHNFKNSLALYEFLTGYTKKGFEVENVSVKTSPFKEKMSESYAEIVYLTSYLTYLYGNKMEHFAKKRYEASEKKRKEEEENHFLAEIRRIGKDIKEANVTPEEYVLMLQKGQKILEKKLLLKDQEVIDAKNSIEEKMREVNVEFVQRVNDEKARLDYEYKIKNEEYMALVKAKEDSLDNTIREKEEDCQRRIAEIYQEKEDYLSSYKDNVNSLKEEINRLNDELALKNLSLQEKENQISQMDASFKEEKRILQSLADITRFTNGEDISNDHIGKDEFAELELQKEAFERYYEEVWKNNKKFIRKEIYASEKYKRGKKGKKFFLDKKSDKEDFSDTNEDSK